jgi:nucleotide-binding universal stress UspA family protein
VFTKLLVPLDGSALAEQALGQAAAIARASGASIDLVSVHEQIAHDGYGEAQVDHRRWNDEHRYLETIAAELASGGGIRVTHSMMGGDPQEMICRRAADVDADLIVITSHGRTGFSRTWFGSVADGLVRHAPTSLLILRPIAGDARRAAAHHLFKKVLVPLDGSMLAGEILSTVSNLARCGNASISLLGVVQPLLASAFEPASLLPYSFLLRDGTAIAHLVEDATNDLQAVADRLHAEGTTPVDSHVVVTQNVAHGVIEFARSHDVDLIAMSTHGRGTSRYFVGSVADKVLRASGLPMLLRRSVPAAYLAPGPQIEAALPKRSSAPPQSSQTDDDDPSFIRNNDGALFV